jgi:hypothetical protein
MTGIRVGICRTDPFGSLVMIVILRALKPVTMCHREKYLEMGKGSAKEFRQADTEKRRLSRHSPAGRPR